MASMIDHTHDPSLRSWVDSANAPETDFPIQNLPFGTFRTQAGERPRAGVAIGDQILDVSSALGIESVLSVMGQPHAARRELRHRISAILAHRQPGSERFVIPMAEAELLLPCPIGDYTDFYASIHHATNVGSMFRPDNPLLPNYKWVPIGYHGRASSIQVSGAPVRRPWGQTSEASGGPPTFAPSRRLDYELEIGAFIGPGNQTGQPIAIGEAEDHLVGLCLLNDWSARDIQSWEYQPLGPFLAKNFATTISPWVVTLEALAPFCRPAPQRPAGDPEPLPYLAAGVTSAFGIQLSVWLRSALMPEAVQISGSDFASLYWTLGQMIAHHTSNGCPMQPGDLIGSGTVSGPEKHNRGCLLELSWRGTDPVVLPTGETRAFLADGDSVKFRADCEANGFRRIGFGECSGTVYPAH